MASGVTTDPVKSFGSLIWDDSENSHSHICVKTYSSKYHDMCPILSFSDAPLLFLSTITKTSSWAYWHFSEDVTTLTDYCFVQPPLIISGLSELSYYPLFVWLSSPQVHWDYCWDMGTRENARLAAFFFFFGMNLTRLTKMLNIALNLENRTEQNT